MRKKKSTEYSEIEMAIMTTNCLGIRGSQALSCIKALTNQEITEGTMQRLRKRLRNKVDSQIYSIAMNMREYHMHTLFELDLIKKEMWKNYELETQPIKKTSILNSIRDMIPYITAYIEATQQLVQQSVSRELVRKMD